MKKLDTILILLALLLFASCNNSKDKQYTSFDDLFQKKEKMKEVNFTFEDDSIRSPYMMECTNGSLLLANMNLPTIVSAFSLKNGKYQGDYIHRGTGPDEYLFFSSMTSDNHNLMFWDSDLGTMVYMDFSKLNNLEKSNYQVKIQTNPIVTSIFQAIPLNKRCIAGTGLIKEKRIALFDDKGKVVTTFGIYPQENSNKKYTDVENGFAYQSLLAFQSTKQILAVGSYWGESIAFYDLQDMKNPTIVKEYVFAFPQYKDSTDKENMSVTFTDKNITGFVAIKATEKYCICLYSGKIRTKENVYGGDKILIFDWAGKPVKMIELNQNYQNMAIDESKQEIILLGGESDTAEYFMRKIRI